MYSSRYIHVFISYLGHAAIPQRFRVQRVLSDDNSGPLVLLPLRHIPLQLGQGAAREQGAEPDPVPLVLCQLGSGPVPQPHVLRGSGSQGGALPRRLNPLYEVLEGLLLQVMAKYDSMFPPYQGTVTVPWYHTYCSFSTAGIKKVLL